MRPFTVLIGILLGSAASITFGLAAVAIVFGIITWIHPELAPDLAVEQPRLGVSLFVFAILTATSAGSFVGQLRSLKWRRWAHLVTVACLVGVFVYFWPRGA
jgi:uncharacterized membrane protein